MASVVAVFWLTGTDTTEKRSVQRRRASKWYQEDSGAASLCQALPPGTCGDIHRVLAGKGRPVNRMLHQHFRRGGQAHSPGDGEHHQQLLKVGEITQELRQAPTHQNHEARSSTSPLLRIRSNSAAKLRPCWPEQTPFSRYSASSRAGCFPAAACLFPGSMLSLSACNADHRARTARYPATAATLEMTRHPAHR